MRWEALFADLEAQLAAASATEDADLERAEVARTPLEDRVRAHVGATLRLRLRDGTSLVGALREAGAGWLLLDAERVAVLVPAAAVSAVGGLSRAVAAPAGQVERRVGLGSVLRALARDRAPVRVQVEGAVLTGTVDRVGADHLDLAEHPAGEARRPSAVREVVTVPFAALLSVRSGA